MLWSVDKAIASGSIEALIIDEIIGPAWKACRAVIREVLFPRTANLSAGFCR